MPVVSIAVPGVVFEKVLSNAQEAKARDAQLIGVAPQGPDTELFDELLPVPMVSEWTALCSPWCRCSAELSHRGPSRLGCGSTTQLGQTRHSGVSSKAGLASSAQPQSSPVITRSVEHIGAPILMVQVPGNSCC